MWCCAVVQVVNGLNAQLAEEREAAEAAGRVAEAKVIPLFL